MKSVELRAAKPRSGSGRRVKGVSAPKSDRSADAATVTRAVASAITDQLEISGIRFSRFSAESSHTGLDKLPSNIDVSLKFSCPKVLLQDQSVLITTVFSAEFKAGTDFRVVVSIATELLYKKKQNVGEIQSVELDKFARVNAPFNAWSYWREFLQSALTRLGLPPVALPLLRAGQIESLMKD